jgi:hypothetical protein
LLISNKTREKRRLDLFFRANSAKSESSDTRDRLAGSVSLWDGAALLNAPPQQGGKKNEREMLKLNAKASSLL